MQKICNIMARTKQQQPESNPALSIKAVTKNSVWDIQENDVFRMWEAATKDAEVKENIQHYLDIFKSAFLIEEIKDEAPAVKKGYEKRGYKVMDIKFDENLKFLWAIKKRPITRVTDLSYENIRHISAAKLLEVIDRNFGGGWDSLSQSIQDIILSGFDISTTTLPKDRLHKKGGMYEKKVDDGFDVLEVVSKMEVEKLPEDAWEDYEDKQHQHVPSPALQLLTLAYLQLKCEPTVGRALQMMPLLQLAVSRYPEGEDVRRYSAFVYMIMGEPTKAISLYNKILQHRHEPRLYAELADIIDDPCYKAGLLCKAIEHESREAYRTGYRLDLAQLLLGKEDGHAAYELQRCIANRQSQGSPLSSQMLAMQARLQGVAPATEAEQQAFYRKVTSQNHVV